MQYVTADYWSHNKIAISRYDISDYIMLAMLPFQVPFEESSCYENEVLALSTSRN